MAGFGISALAASAGGVVAAGVLILSGLGGEATIASVQDDEALEPFQNAQDLRRFLRERRETRRREEFNYSSDSVVMEAAPSPSAQASQNMGGVADTEEIIVTGSRAPDSITNNQEADVDEGGIVKMADADTLVVLRRGRIFSIDISNGGMRAVDVENAYPPGVDGSGGWYDEMLVSDGWVVVIGYSYERSGTEINRFRIDADGQMTYVDAFQLRSNDYYSSRNYASRLVGDELVFYTPLYLDWVDDPLEVLPGVRRWNGHDDAPFQPIAAPDQIYVPRSLKDDRQSDVSTLHTLSRCDLTAQRMDCRAIGVLGPASRTFYVSSNAVYLWTNEPGWSRARDRAAAFLYRLPMRRGEPQAIGVRGAPIDQFSFRENARDRTLDVLVTATGDGDAMWAPEAAAGQPALLRLPLSRFGDGSRNASDDLYRPLPMAGQGWLGRNRFVGGYILYGYESGGFGGDGGHHLVAAPVAGGQATDLPMRQSIDRIEQVGSDAMIVGSDNDSIVFSTLELTRGPRLGESYVMRNASEAEDRSHAFFYRPDPDSPDGASGLMGLPVSVAADARFSYLFYSSADMLFLRRDNRRLSPFGRLNSQPGGAANDNCVASCVDWYGNARPIFVGGRVFALLGYELVEGRSGRGEIQEIGRLNFSPARARPGRTK